MRITRSVSAEIESALDFMHARRRAAVVAAIAGLWSGAVATLTGIGRAIGSSSAKHGIKRVDRLLRNPRLHAELDLVYEAVLSRLLRRHRRPIVLVDWTELVSGLVALRAAIALDGRAVPIFATVHPKGHLGRASVERRFLKRLRALFPDDTRAVVVTDAGFRGPWFEAVHKLGWDYIGRLNAGVNVQPVTGGPWRKVSELFERASRRPRRWGLHRVRKKRSFQAYIVAFDGRSRRARRSLPQGKSYGGPAKRKCAIRARHPWVLVTSLEEPAPDVVGIYRTRMQVEELFRDDKNHRWGWGFEHSRTADRKRLEVLLAILAIASVAVLLVGWAAERQRLHRPYQANTERRRVLSLQTLGRLVLRDPPPGFRLTAHDFADFASALGHLP